MTQLDRALRALAVLQPTGPDANAAKVLAEIVGEGQNQPSDGSISVEQWYALRGVVRTYSAFRRAVDSALRMQGKGP